MKSEKRQRPRKSLRTILILWLLIFSVVPLAFITGYSLVKYEQAIDQELSTRLLGNALTIGATFGDYQSTLMSESRQIAGDKALAYYLALNNVTQARDGVKRWFERSFGHRLWVFNRDARLELAFYKDEHGQVQRRANLENGVVELNDSMIKAISDKD